MMHYAVTHQTAAEIVYDRADSEKPHMGLMTWKNVPDWKSPLFMTFLNNLVCFHIVFIIVGFHPTFSCQGND